MNSLAQKMVKYILVFIVKILPSKELLLKIEHEK